MNDPNKAIDVNLSSLLSLKAELLRKQAEVSKAKVTQQSADEYVASRTSTSSGNSSASSGKKDKKQDNRELNEPLKADNAKVCEHEDSALLEKSQRVLQAKSKFYERMTRTGGKLNSDDNCLVLFNRKQQEEKTPTTDPFQEQLYEISSDSELSLSEEEGDDDRNTDPEDDWVEYIDCLGRTRKCLRKDLDVVKRRDTELAASMPERLDQSKPNWMLDTKGTLTNNTSNADNDGDDDDDIPIGPMPTESIYSDGCSLMSKHDEQRANWERKEVENLDKSDVHYQDVFFDEARQHGVGYYAFSTDEEERKRQQNELEESRQQTISEQEHRDTLRAQREKIIAERVRSAKNRQRARLGLPPLEEEIEKSKEQEVAHKETKEERHARKRAEKLKRKQEKAEKEREQERQQHIRPWDKEKDGVTSKATTSAMLANENDPTDAEWMYKPERQPMSQQEWNEQQRAVRNPEFAPASTEATPKLKRKHFSNSNDGSMPPPAAPPPRARESYNMVPPPPPQSQPFSASTDTTFSSYQSTKRSKEFHRRSYEISTGDASNVVDDADIDKSRTRAAIPPPENLDPDFTLPAHSKRPKSHNELERSIEAGLRFLRNNSDKSTTSSKSTWTAKADY